MSQTGQALIVVSLAAMIAILHIGRLLHQPEYKGIRTQTTIAALELILLFAMLTVIAATSIGNYI